MPDEATVKAMYGNGYFDGEANAARFDWVKEHLHGTVIDYGCGSGELLNLAASVGCEAVGIEFNPEVVASLRERLPHRFYLVGECQEQADVLHLGDVIEHLTDIHTELPKILSLLKPGGTLIAHNPLEGNMNLFAWIMSLSRRLRGTVESVPYHVTLATTQAYEALFQRLGFSGTFEIEQVDWPAPSRLTSSPKQNALYALRRLSQVLSSQRSGNRYRFVGRNVVN